MAKMKVTPRRLIVEDKVYRQILHAEVIFQLFLDLFKLSAVCGKCVQGQMNTRWFSCNLKELIPLRYSCCDCVLW